MRIGTLKETYIADAALFDSRTQKVWLAVGATLAPQRGLLEDTLVICMGEFGRAPVINKEAGSRTITLALNGHSAGKAAVYTLGADNNLVAQQGVDVNGRITVPGPSVVLMRIPAKA